MQKDRNEIEIFLGIVRDNDKREPCEKLDGLNDPKRFVCTILHGAEILNIK